MKQHSMVNLITNSSTVIFTLAIKDQGQRLMDLLKPECTVYVVPTDYWDDDLKKEFSFNRYTSIEDVIAAEKYWDESDYEDYYSTSTIFVVVSDGKIDFDVTTILNKLFVSEEGMN